MTITDKNRIDELRNTLNAHNHKYYVLNEPSISDLEYDMLMKELQELESKNPEYFDELSPTQRVGSDINSSFTQIEHKYPMLSLGNTYSMSEVEDFVYRIANGLNGEKYIIIGELKYDGTSISITYHDGKLVQAVTRGDGVKGDDVTNNIKTIKSIPLRLQGADYPVDFEVRGEILMPWKVFERINKEREFNEEPLFANPRNAASGTLKLQNSSIVAERSLDAYFYYLLGENIPTKSHYENMQLLRKWGFKVSDAMKQLYSKNEITDYINYWDTQRKFLPVATDGLVFKVDSIPQQKELGYTAKSPKWAVAYKFKAESALTKLLKVTFEVGRTGTVTPVANLEAVQLSGTIVRRATLHNEDFVRNLDLHNNDMVYVEKGGEIIPKITGVELSQRDSKSNIIKFVTHCPICGTLLERKEGESAWYCPNTNGCAPQIAGKIEHFVSRKAMDIDGIGEEMTNQLYESGLVTNIADIYNLTKEQIVELDRKGNKSADRIIAGIKTSLSVPFERVIYSLSIPFVGETIAKILAKALKNIDNLIYATVEELIMIEEIGPKIADSIVKFFQEPKNKEIVERLRIAGCNMSISENVELYNTKKLNGKTFVISGTFSLHSRDEYKEMIELNGGKNASSVSSKTDYIIAGENMGPAKLEKAHKLNINIIDEVSFLKMIE